MKEGLQTQWYEDGSKQAEINVSAGEKNGLQTWWHKDGHKETENNFKNGKLDGLTIEYDTLGKESYRAVYSKGILKAEFESR